MNKGGEDKQHQQAGLAQKHQMPIASIHQKMACGFLFTFQKQSSFFFICKHGEMKKLH
jgi:hypothetical protein